jgi:hypothetical protein
MQWCDHKISYYIPLPNGFLPHNRRRLIPQWYRDLLERARDHVQSGEAPEFQFAWKPRKQDGWVVGRQVLETTDSEHSDI